MRITKHYIKHLTYKINGAAIEVHKNLGPGLLESAYHSAMIYELELRDLRFSSEFSIPIKYKGKILDKSFRCDLFIEDLIVVELKAIESIKNLHKAQLINYMKLLKAPKGILYNFNVINLYSNGQKTLVNEHFEKLSN